MDLTRTAIEKNRITLVCAAVIIFGGIGAFNNLPRAEDPGFIMRVAQIVTYFPGASPERVETLVTEPLETAIREMPEVKFVTSTSKTGVSIVIVEVKQSYKVMRPIWDKLKDKVDRVRPNLPRGTIGPNVNDEFGDVFGIMLSITGDGFDNTEIAQVADEVRNELLTLQDAAKVDVYGEREERIFVEYDTARLARSGVSIYQLQQILDSANIVSPGGDIRIGDERIELEPSGNFESLDDLKKTVVNLPDGKVTYLENLVSIDRRFTEPPESVMHTNGKPSVCLAMSLRDGGNIIRQGDDVKALIARLEAQYPLGIEFELVAFQPTAVEQSVNDFTENLLQAVLIVMGVMLVTLGFRTGVLVASLIPMAILMALLFMQVFGIGIDQVSMAALIIALGMLVDNAIVMSESIQVMVSRGKSTKQAAIDSASELRVPLLTSSLTTAAAFLPIFLAKSQTGEYTAPIFKVVTITLLSSWLISLTVIPLLCVFFLKAKPVDESDAYSGIFYRAYRGLLGGMVRMRWLTLAATVGVFVYVMSLGGKVPAKFFPPSERPLVIADFTLPEGTPVETTKAMVEEIEAYITKELLASEEKDGPVASWAAFVGASGPRFVMQYNPQPPTPGFASLIINTSGPEHNDTVITSLETFVQRFPDVEPRIKRLDYGPPVSKPVAIRISGRDRDTVLRIADKVEQRLAQVDGSKEVNDNWGAWTKKMPVRIDQARARREGVSNSDVAVSLQSALKGIDTTQYREDDKAIPVTLRSVTPQRTDLDRLRNTSVYSTSGRTVPLEQVADIGLQWQPSKVLRRDALKTVTVSSELQPGAAAAPIAQEMGEWLAEESKTWPTGYKYEIGGEAETSAEANKSIADQLPIAMFIIIVLLVGQFNSVRRATIILSTVPLGLIGVILGLLGTGSYFGFMTLLGVVSLAGIVINNAIVLIERIELEKDVNGRNPFDAVIFASQTRLRPILLTTATTVGGLLPLWFGGGAMWEPMAIVIIFGLLFSTVLTLGVVPVLYAILFRVKRVKSEVDLEPEPAV